MTDPTKILDSDRKACAESDALLDSLLQEQLGGRTADDIAAEVEPDLDALIAETQQPVTPYNQQKARLEKLSRQIQAGVFNAEKARRQ